MDKFLGVAFIALLATLPTVTLAKSMCVMVTERNPTISLPSPVGKLVVLAPGEDNKEYPQAVQGTTGMVLIGRHGDDYGIEYPVRYIEKNGTKENGGIHNLCVIKIKD